MRHRDSMWRLLNRPHDHLWTRRRVLGSVVATTGLVIGADLLVPAAALAAETGTPRPIPTGIQPFGPNGPLFHVHPPPESETRASDDFSTITDFNGFVGLSHVTGNGVGVTSGVSKSLTYAVDNRFMVGEFVGTDGELHRGTFGFV
jgi:hypothetical protein